MSDPGSDLPEGLYESPITRALAARLAHLADVEVEHSSIDAADEPEVLARHVRDVTLRASVKSEMENAA